MRRFVSCFGLAAIAILVLGNTPGARAETLRYTVTANVSGIVWGTALPNCVTNACTITITGLGDSLNAAAFPLVCTVTPTCVYKGQGAAGFWNRTLTNVTVTIYDPISGTTYGPGTLPNGFYVSFDTYNGGIGFGNDSIGGPAYPVAINFPGDVYPYEYSELPSYYDLTSPVLAGGLFNNCPDPSLPCNVTPLPEIPVTLADNSTVMLSLPLHFGFSGNFWTEEVPSPNQWTTVAPMLQARAGHTATGLFDDTVLVVGGTGGSTAATTAEVYNSTANTWSATGSPSCGRTGHTATLLQSGKVLVVGGTQCPTGAEVFDPAAQTFTTVTPSPIAFPGPSAAVKLADGRVLVAGANGAEIYDPVANAWSGTTGFTAAANPAMATQYYPGTLVVLADNGSCQTGGSFTVEVFDPATATWTAGPGGSNCSSAPLTVSGIDTGGFLVTGVLNSTVVTAEYAPSGWYSIFDPVAKAWLVGLGAATATDEFILPLGGNEVVTPNQYGVLFVGGTGLVAQPNVGAPTPTFQVPAPVSPLYTPYGTYYGWWSTKPALNVGRTGHAVVTLNSFDVLAIGGMSIGPTPSAMSSVERLNTSYIPTTAAPTFSLAGGTYNTPQTLTLTDTTGGSTIYYSYTPTGSTPYLGGPNTYTGPITINQSGLVEAIALSNFHNPSAVSVKAYVYAPLSPAAAPFFNLAGGTYHSPQKLTLTDSTPGAAIHYTTNGTPPTASSTLYTGPITIASTETVEAAAIATGFSLSPVSAKAYVYVPFTPAAAPSFSLAGGTYNTPQMLTLTDATPGATIYYTTNGTSPTTGSTVYSGPISIASTETVEAAAIASGYSLSPVSAKAYTYISLPLASPPFFHLAGGHYTTPQMLTLTDATAGATIYYTTNGTTPTTSSTVYTGPITISTTETVIAIAAAPGFANSNPAAKAYTIP